MGKQHIFVLLKEAVTMERIRIDLLGFSKVVVDYLNPYRPTNSFLLSLLASALQVFAKTPP